MKKRITRKMRRELKNSVKIINYNETILSKTYKLD